MTLEESQALNLAQMIELAATVIQNEVYPLVNQIMDKQEAKGWTAADVIPLLAGTAFEGLTASELTQAFVALAAINTLLDADTEQHKRALLRLIP